MREAKMPTLEELNRLLQPLFPGTMGVELLEAQPDKVRASLRVRPGLCTTGETLHGGAFMAFADALGGVGTALNLPPGARTTTIESKTNFLGGAPLGTTITAETTPLHRGRTTQVWQTRITNESGKLAAVVIQTQLVLPA